MQFSSRALTDPSVRRLGCIQVVGTTRLPASPNAFVRLLDPCEIELNMAFPMRGDSGHPSNALWVPAPPLDWLPLARGQLQHLAILGKTCSPGKRPKTAFKRIRTRSLTGTHAGNMKVVAADTHLLLHSLYSRSCTRSSNKNLLNTL